MKKLLQTDLKDELELMRIPGPGGRGQQVLQAEQTAHAKVCRKKFRERIWRMEQ